MGELVCYNVRLRLSSLNDVSPRTTLMFCRRQAFQVATQIVQGITNIAPNNNRIGLAHFSSPDARTGVSLDLNTGTSQAVALQAINSAQASFQQYLGMSDLDGYSACDETSQTLVAKHCWRCSGIQLVLNRMLIPAYDRPTFSNVVVIIGTG